MTTPREAGAQTHVLSDPHDLSVYSLKVVEPICKDVARREPSER